MTQHFFLLSILIATVTITTLVVRLWGDRTTSISLHAVKHKVAFLTFAIGITLALVLNTAYLTSWLIPAGGLNNIGAVLYVILLGLILVTVWTPDIAGKLRTIHRLAAYGAVLVMPGVLTSLLLSFSEPVYLKLINLGIIVSHCVMIYLLFFAPSARRYFLTYQVVYLTGFFIAMLGFTYLRLT